MHLTTFKQRKPRFRWALLVAIVLILIICNTVFAYDEIPAEVSVEAVQITGENTVFEEPKQAESPTEAVDEEQPDEDSAADGQPIKEPALGDEPTDGSTNKAEEESESENESGDVSSEDTQDSDEAEKPFDGIWEELPKEDGQDPESDPDEGANNEEETGTEIMDNSDDISDLSNQDSIQVYESGDPWWKVGSTTYMTNFPGMCPAETLGVTCWESATPIQDALDRIDGGLLPSDRKLYVESGTYSESITLLDTSPLLTLLNGIIGAGSATTTINGDINIEGNLNGFTLSGFTIFGNVAFKENSGTLKLEDLEVSNDSGNGIDVNNHNGNVELNNVKSNNNYGGGASIQNGDSSGSVKIINSSFDNNGNIDNDSSETGLSIITSKTITIEGVSASRNMGLGILAYNFSKLAISNVIASYNEDPYTEESLGIGGIYAFTEKAASVVFDYIQANYNGGDGISLSTLGSVKTNYIEANYNTIRQGGILYDYTYWLCLNDECTETEEVTEIIRKVEEFLSDDVDYDEWRFEGTDGLEVNIILETSQWMNGFDPIVRLYDSSYNLIAEDDNSYDGLWDSQILTTLSADDIYYIRVYSHEGDSSSRYTLSVNYDETSSQAWLSGTGFSYNDQQGKSSFRLTNGTFHQNASDGLSVSNRNSIYISSVTSTENGSYGISLDNTGSEWDCSSGESCMLLGYYGKGSVTITSPKSTGWLTANNASGNGQAGVYIQSNGSILVSNIEASENTTQGLYLDNCLHDWNTGMCLGSGSVTVNTTISNWINIISGNLQEGISINTKSSVKVDKTQAISNQSDGFNIRSLSTIRMTGSQGNHNNGYGAYLYTLDASSPKTVTVADSLFDNNEDTGLKIETAGAIKLQGVSASENQSPTIGSFRNIPVTLYDQIYNGATLESYSFYGRAGEEVTIILTSDDFDAYLELLDGLGATLAYDDNGYGGTNARITYTLPADDWYQIFVSYAGVDEFGGYVLSINDEDHAYPIFSGSGVELNNTAGTASVVLTTTKTNPYSNFDSNANQGIYIKSNGSISVTGASASGNFLSGISLDNPTSSGSVIIQDKSKNPQSTFDNNGMTGIYLQTFGSVKLYGISANGNGYSGVSIDNCKFDEGLGGCLGSKTVIVQNKSGIVSTFSENALNGISIESGGVIKVTNVVANNNGVKGLFLYNQYENSSAGITISSSGSLANQFSGNGWNAEESDNPNGLSVYTNGAISVANVEANNNLNGGGGIVLWNHQGLNAKSVKLTNSVSNGNDLIGLDILSLGTINLKNIEASDNNGDGAIIRNDFEEYSGSVSLQYQKGYSNTFDSNNGSGLIIATNGSVSTGNLSVNSNYLTYGELFGSLRSLGTSSVQEYYNEIAGTDVWGFYGESGVAYTIQLNVSDDVDLDPFGFDPYFEIYDSGDTLLDWDDNSGGDNNALISFTPTSDGWYYLHVSGDMDGFYLLGINDPSFSDRTYIWNSGTSITAGKNVTIKGSQASEFVSNSLAGLSVYTPGSISITWVNTEGNGTEGILLDTQSGTGNINMKGKNSTTTSNFKSNGWHGLSILSDGSTSLNYLWASDNGMTGIKVGNDDLPTGKKVSLNNLTALGNAGNGIDVHSLDAITTKNIHALENGASGAVLVNSSGLAIVTVTGDSFFGANGANGLEIESAGKVKISKVYAENNHGIGIDVDANTADISLNSVYANYSGQDGIKLNTDGNIAILKVNGFSNGSGVDGDGLFIEASAASQVIIKSSAFIGNEGNGIEVQGVMPILSKSWYFGNDTDGDGEAAQTNLYVHYT